MIPRDSPDGRICGLPLKKSKSEKWGIISGKSLYCNLLWPPFDKKKGKIGPSDANCSVPLVSVNSISKKKLSFPYKFENL